MINLLKSVRRSLMCAGRSVKTRVGYFKRLVITPSMPKNPDGMVYINLGSGAYTSPEFINIDSRTMPQVHYIADVERLPMFADGSADLIYASHLVEHINRGDLPTVLREWRRVLKNGGILRFGVPDFDGLVEIYQTSGKDVNSIMSQLLGQTPPYDDHHTIWNFKYAEALLKNAGFKIIRLWDPKKVDHHNFTDKTGRAMDIGGRLISISLNVEAVK